MVECAQPGLYVGASAHLLGAAHQHANRTAANFSEQLCLLGFRIGIMDELYLLFGNLPHSLDIGHLLDVDQILQRRAPAQADAVPAP